MLESFGNKCILSSCLLIGEENFTRVNLSVLLFVYFFLSFDASKHRANLKVDSLLLHPDVSKLRSCTMW